MYTEEQYLIDKAEIEKEDQERRILREKYERRLILSKNLMFFIVIMIFCFCDYFFDHDLSNNAVVLCVIILLWLGRE